MSKRLLFVIVAAALIGTFLFGHMNGSGSGGPLSPAPSATASAQPSENAAGASPGDGGAQPSTSPGAPAVTPVPDTPLPVLGKDSSADLATAIAAMAAVQPLHIHFSGAENAGTLVLDVVTDAHGGLQGTYTLNGSPLGIVVIGRAIYLHGPAATIEAYTRVPMKAGVTSWVKLPSGFNPDLLGTLATPRLLSTCLSDISSAHSTWDTVAPPAAPPAQARTWLRPGDEQYWPWTFGLNPGANPQVAAFDLVTTGGPSSTPASCNNGAYAVTGPDGAAGGVFTFTTAGPPSVGPPPGWIDYPIANSEPGY